MAKDMMTIYISDTVIRFMTTDGKHVTDWAELQFDPDQIEGNVVLEEDRVADKIKQFLDLKSMKTRKVLVGIGGIRCLTRPVMLPKLPGEIIDEAVRREAERVLPVPLDELYMSWQSIPAPEGKTQIFLTAIPRRIVKPLIDTLDKAGLKPVFMDLKPLLLARVAREETAILLDVQESDFDIVVMVKGIPQPIRTVEFPGENAMAEEKLAIIREELNRTITFYNSNNPETMIADDVCVHVSGMFKDEAEFCRRLAEETGRAVELLPSPVDTPEGFNPLLYMANIGLLLQATASGKNLGPSVVNLNTLPPEYLPQPVSSLNILKMLGIAFMVIILAGMAYYMQDLRGDVSARQLTLQTTKNLLTKKQIEMGALNKQIRELNDQITVLETEKESLTTALSILELKTLGMNEDISVTFDRLPKKVSLISLQHDNSEITITGLAEDEAGVLSYFSNLEMSERFSGIEIQNMSTREDELMDFTFRCSTMIDSSWISGIGVILGNLPTSISLEFASTSDTVLTLTGNSPTETILMAYLQRLDDSGKFETININSVTRLDDESYDFEVQLMIGVMIDEDA